jgi:hypothetical protein
MTIWFDTESDLPFVINLIHCVHHGKNQSKKKRILIQPTLFGVEKSPLTQKKTEKIGLNEFKVVEEFVRKETGKEADKKGVFKAKCSFCSKDFLTTNALSSHMKFCETALCWAHSRREELRVNSQGEVN